MASADTNQDSTNSVVDRQDNPVKDSDFDQVRRPQGTLMIELYNPNPPLAVGNSYGGQYANELYALATNYPPVGSAPRCSQPQPNPASLNPQTATDETVVPIFGEPGGRQSIRHPNVAVGSAQRRGGQADEHFGTRHGRTIVAALAARAASAATAAKGLDARADFRDEYAAAARLCAAVPAAPLNQTLPGLTNVAANLPVIDRAIYFTYSVPDGVSPIQPGGQPMQNINEGVQRFTSRQR